MNRVMSLGRNTNNLQMGLLKRVETCIFYGFYFTPETPSVNVKRTSPHVCTERRQNVTADCSVVLMLNKTTQKNCVISIITSSAVKYQGILNTLPIRVTTAKAAARGNPSTPCDQSGVRADRRGGIIALRDATPRWGLSSGSQLILVIGVVWFWNLLWYLTGEQKPEGGVWDVNRTGEKPDGIDTPLIASV